MSWKLPSHDEPRETPPLRETADFCPLVEELPADSSAVEVFRRWRQLPHCLFLDSARRDPVLGRYSFVAADPFDWLQCDVPAEGRPESWRLLEGMLAGLTAATIPELPPFQGGAAGLLGYGLGRETERLPRTRYEEFSVPALAVGLYDVVAAFDHAENRAWLISQGLPETEPGARRRRAAARLRQARQWLEQPAEAGRALANGAGRPSFAASDLAPQYPLSGQRGVSSNFSREGYLQAVAAGVEYVHAGDVFQVNLSQRLLQPDDGCPVALYERLRERNSATFAAYFDLGAWQILSASPERFLQVRGGRVEARPIKGTRRRQSHPEADLYTGDELRESEKDRAENVMIVDLMRNDLARVCLPHSVRVTQLCRIELSEYVAHLVSAIEGNLAAAVTPLDALRCAFPGGSVTGAPKIRAMQIIAELEPTARGPYCGSLMYLGFDGTLDASILIRTVTVGGGWRQFPVGGGIVAQSDPAREYEETLHKAEGILRALA